MSQFVSSIAADDSDGLSLEFALGLYASNRLLLSRHADDDLPADERGIVMTSDDDDPNERLLSVVWGSACVVLLSSHKEYVLDVSHVGAGELAAAWAMLARMNHDAVVTVEE